LPGVEDLEAEGPRVSFTQHSQPDALVKLAARHRLVGLTYERPSLKEIFLTYYAMNVARVRGTDGVGTRPCAAALAFQYTRLKARA
jgi:hypothetical protein